MHQSQPTWQKKGRAYILLMIMVVSIYPQAVSAGVWGESMAASIWKQISENIWTQIQGVILTNLKMVAVRAINRQIEGLVAGVNGSGALFITNWQQYLIQIPREENQLYMNDLLSQSTRGKCSGLNYESIAKGNFDMNYISSLCQSARYGGSGANALFQVTIDQYSSAPLRDIQEGNFRTLNAMLPNPANNPFGFSMLAWEAQQRDLAQRQERAKTEAVAGQGYLGVKKNGITVTPGRTVADLIENVKTLGNNIMAGASNPAEFIGGVIAQVANAAINQMLQKGFEQVDAAIAREQNKVNARILEAAKDVNKSLGPASQYIKGVNQLTGTANGMYGAVGKKPDKGCAGVASGYGGC